jgi:hypothetical protein
MRIIKNNSKQATAPPIGALYEQLCQTIGNIVEHPDVPVRVADKLVELFDEMEDDVAPLACERIRAARVRGAGALVIRMWHEQLTVDESRAALRAV